MWALQTLALLTLSVVFVLYCASRAAHQSRRDGVTIEQNTLTRVQNGPLEIVIWIGVALIAVPFYVVMFIL